MKFSCRTIVLNFIMFYQYIRYRNKYLKTDVFMILRCQNDSVKVDHALLLKVPVKDVFR